MAGAASGAITYAYFNGTQYSRWRNYRWSEDDGKMTNGEARTLQSEGARRKAESPLVARQLEGLGVDGAVEHLTFPKQPNDQGDHDRSHGYRRIE